MKKNVKNGNLQLWTHPERMLSKPSRSQSYKFKEIAKNRNTQHISGSWLIRCVNMTWIRLIFWKIQSGHGSVHRRTNGQTDKVKTVSPPPPYLQLRWRGGYKKVSSLTRGFELYLISDSEMSIANSPRKTGRHEVVLTQYPHVWIMEIRIGQQVHLEILQRCLRDLSLIISLDVFNEAIC